MSDVEAAQTLFEAAIFKAHIEIKLEKAEVIMNQAIFYGKMTASKNGTVIFEKKSTDPVEVKIGDDIPLLIDDIHVAARDSTFDVNADLYYAVISKSMVSGKTTFDIKKGTYAQTISGPNGSINVTVTFTPWP